MFKNVAMMLLFKMKMLVTMTLLMTTLTLAQSCTPETDQELTVEKKMRKSDIFLYGYPRDRWRDNKHPGKELYIVDFEVRCVFKGGPFEEKLRIYNVGEMDAMCNKTVLTKDKPLLIYLRRLEDDRLVPIYKEDPGDPAYLDEIPVMCGITISYPIGYSEMKNKEKCPEPWGYDECEEDPYAAKENVTSETRDVGKGEDSRENSNAGKESPDEKAPYQTVKPGTGGDDDHVHVNVGKSTKNGGKKGKTQKSGDMKQADGEGKITPDNKGAGNKSTVVISLVTFLACLRMVWL